MLFERRKEATAVPFRQQFPVAVVYFALGVGVVFRCVDGGSLSTARRNAIIVVDGGAFLGWVCCSISRISVIQTRECGAQGQIRLFFNSSVPPNVISVPTELFSQNNQLLVIQSFPGRNDLGSLCQFHLYRTGRLLRPTNFVAGL